MAKIKMNLEELRKCGSSIESKKEMLKNLNERFQKLISDIQSSWEGEASLAYIAMLGNYLTSAAQMIEVLNEFKLYVDNATEHFDSLDEKSAQIIRNINF